MTSNNARAHGYARDVDPEFRDGLIELIPFLRAFARTLAGDRDEADDLCQEALAKALQSSASFERGTNLKAWVFMILRNHFYSVKRRAWRERRWDDAMAERLSTPGGAQTDELNLRDLSRAMRHLSDEQREALVLVGAGGFSCEEASRICGCAVGTIKSRVARARGALLAALENPEPGRSLGPRQKGEGGAADGILEELDQLAPHPPEGHVDEPSKD
jgi:RNA polymerase sigma-70 factor (ECF subfamily)